MVLYLVLAWCLPFCCLRVDRRYLDSVLPDEFGIRRKPLFFLDKTYWGYKPSCKTQSTTRPLDLTKWLDALETHFLKQSDPRSRSTRFLFWRRNRPSNPKFPNLPQQPSSLTKDGETDIEVSLLRDLAQDPLTPAALRVVHLRKQFGKNETVAVRDSNFVMNQGELLAILGANGSGKSTTCHVLCGITPATAGDALVDDSFSLLESVGLVGWCPQHDILFDELTPLEHVISPPWSVCLPVASVVSNWSANLRSRCMRRFVELRRMR